MSLRSRRGRSQTRYSESTNADWSNVLLDEDDQKEFVESIKKEATSQTTFFQAIFCFGIGGIAILFSLILPVLCPDECTKDDEIAPICWYHSIYSSLLHVWSVHPFALRRSLSIKPPRIVIDTTLQAIPITLWCTGIFSKDEDRFHLALLICNIVTFFGARLMYWDMQSTKKSLQNLNNASYSYKAL